MSIRHIAWAWEITGLSPITKLVLLALADCSHPETGATFPSHQHIIKKTGLSRRSIVDHISRLEKAGLVTVIRAYDKQTGRQMNNDYRLNTGEGTKNCSLNKGEGAGGAPPRVQDVHGGRVQELHTYPRVEETEVGTNIYTSSKTSSYFDSFWRACPRRIGRAAAYRSFIAALKRGIDARNIIDGMKRYAEWCERNDRAPQFIVHPSTWLNQGRWADELVDDIVEFEKTNGTANLVHQWVTDGTLAADIASLNADQERRHNGVNGSKAIDIHSGFKRLL